MAERVEHFPDCHLWGRRHYSCLLKKYEELLRLDNQKTELIRDLSLAFNIDQHIKKILNDMSEVTNKN